MGTQHEAPGRSRRNGSAAALALALPLLLAFGLRDRPRVVRMLGSSLISAILVEELTAVTNSLQSTTFRFGFYFVTMAIYLVMALALRAVLDGLHWAFFRRTSLRRTAVGPCCQRFRPLPRLCGR